MDIPLTARGIAQLEKLRADGIYPNVQNADCYIRHAAYRADLSDDLRRPAA